MRAGIVKVRLPSRTSATGWRMVEMTVDEAAARQSVVELAQAIEALGRRVEAQDREITALKAAAGRR